MQTYTDAELLEWLKSPDERVNDRALRYLYRELYGMIERMVLNNSGSEEAAADIFQDALITFYNQLREKELSLNCSIKTYVYSVCRNLWLMRLRKQKRETPLQESHESVPVQESVFDTLVETEHSALVKEMLNQLGGDCQQILQYYYFERLRMKKIMQLMSLANEQVAKNKKSRCMKKLRDLVDGQPLFQQLANAY